jgi:cell division protein FtsB
LNQSVDLGIWQRLTQLIVGLIVAACLLGLFFWYLPVFQQNARLRQEILHLENQVQVQKERHQQLERAIRNLRDDPKTLERLAREKLGYAKPGETVIYFEPARVAVPLVH